MTLTPILREPTGDPTAWRGSDFKSKEDLVYEFSPGQVAALEEVLARIQHKPLEAITRSDAGHPALDAFLGEVYREVIHGRGLVVLRGFPVDERPIEDIEKLYWAVCTHLGNGNLLSQNSFGYKMVRVQQELLAGDKQPARGTKSSHELAMHNDAGDLFMLLNVRQAASGGESQFSSGPAAHDSILGTRPDILPILYRGFPRHRRSDQPDDQPAVTPYDVPVFSNNNGRICINFTYSSIIPALVELGRTPTEGEIEALDVLRRTLVLNELEIRMAPGEAAIANNYAMCHSRSDFVDGPTAQQRRLVLRAWTEVDPEDRRLPIGREFFHMENKGGRLGFDEVPGRDGTIARNDYAAVPDDLAELFKATQAKPKVE